MARHDEIRTTESSLVLVIMDEKEIADAISTSMRNVGYRTIIAEDGESGLSVAERYSPDVIVLDTDIEVDRGYEICRELKNRIMTADTPVIFTTRNIDSDDLIQKCFDAGANDLIAKPIRVSLLLARIKVALREANLREQYKKLAMMDQATGLDNRRQFFMHVTEAVSSCLRRDRDAYLMICDIDDLSAINTNHGYDLGDDIIIMLARLTKRLISMDCRVGRIAGDAIAIILKKGDEATADAMAMRVLRTFEAIAFDAGTQPKHFTLSIGVAKCESTDANLTPDELMSRADLATAFAKAQGGRQICRYWQVDPKRLMEFTHTNRYARTGDRPRTHRGSVSVNASNDKPVPNPIDAAE